MSTPQHHYTFEVARPAPSSISGDGVQRFVGSAAAGSPDEAAQLVSAQYPAAVLLTLRLVSPVGDGCGDERCVVCYPSSRNRGALS